jgi:DHA1 family inner membrane transport protein
MSSTVARRKGLNVGYVLFAALFAAQASILVLSPTLPQIAAEFDVSTAAAAQLRSVAGVTAALVALVLAVTGDRFRLGRLLAGGLVLIGVGTMLSAIAPAYLFLLGAHLIIGLGLAAVLSGALAASETWARAGESARVLSWALIGQPVAWIAGQPIVGLLSARSWRLAWVIVGSGSALLALAALAIRDRTVGDDGQRCDPHGLWQQPGVKRWAIGELAAFTAWSGVLVYSGAVFIEAYGLTVAVTGLLLGIVAAFYLPGNFLGRRWLADRGTWLLFVFPLVSSVAAMLFVSARVSLVPAFIAFSAAAFLNGGRTIAGAATGLQVAEGRRLAAMSLRTAAAQCGYLLGAAVGGALLSTWGFPGAGWGMAVLFAIAGLVHIPIGRPGSGTIPTLGRHLRRAST